MHASPLPTSSRPPRTSSPITGGVPGAGGVLVVTIGLWAVMTVLVVVNALAAGAFGDLATTVAIVAYLVLSTLLSFATAMHLLARLGAAHRFATHLPTPLAVARATVRERRPTITVLVPSYREEPQVIRRTLLSAALLEYPDIRVVLLIDDPPHPAPGSGAESLLADARAMPARIEDQLEPLRRRVEAAYGQFLQGSVSGTASASDLYAVSDCLAAVASELRSWAVAWRAGDHGDRLFADQVLVALAREFEVESERTASAATSGTMSRAEVASLYTRLVDTLSVRVTSFERKAYAHLSHEPNKAMNLNSYLGVMGGQLGDRRFPTSDYVLTLDADSVLLPDYALRLVHFMEQPANSRVAVAQTPYSAFPGAAGELERIAGATTDIQYLLHQGFTHYGATFWVGANAVLRRRALDDIAATTLEDGHPITRCIQDRTVIEDTESSLDLLVQGWSLHNLPERLAYSATPPDFGSLVIQRRRWANGGLIILPKLGELLRARGRRGERTPLPGLLLQFHYLTSMPATATGLLLMLLVPAHLLDGIVLPWLVPLLAAPYLLTHALDLARNGYRASDTFRVYGFNMLLVAVNLAGGFRSLQQAFNGTKAPFLRTPKIADRVSAPPSFILFPAVLGVHGLVVAVLSLVTLGSPLGLYAGFTAALTLYGLGELVGARNALDDVVAGFSHRAGEARTALTARSGVSSASAIPAVAATPADLEPRREARLPV